MDGTPRSSSPHDGDLAPPRAMHGLGHGARHGFGHGFRSGTRHAAGLHIYTTAGERLSFQATGPGRRGRPDAPGEPVRILIVEDDLLIALDIEMTLEEAGHEVVGTATTARAAVDAAQEHEPDVVLMDLRLADGSWGGDAAREIRERLDTSLVFLSGNLDPATRERLLPLDPVAMLSKPFLPGQLLKAVAAAA